MAGLAVLVWRLFDGSGQMSEKTAVVGIVPLAAWGHSCVAQVDCSEINKRRIFLELNQLLHLKINCLKCKLFITKGSCGLPPLPLEILFM